MVELELLNQALELMERAYDLMVDHELRSTETHLAIYDKIEDAIDRLLYLQVANNVRRGPKYYGLDKEEKE